jgi:hypothetical protein
MTNNKFDWLHRTGIVSEGTKKGADRAGTPGSNTIAVKRPPEFPSRTTSGPVDGHAKSAKRPDGDGWTPGTNPPSRSGPETLGANDGGKTSPGGPKARAASPAKGVETKSASSDKNTGAAARKTAKTANIEGNESAKYEKLEKKSLKALKEGGSEKELRRGHNNIFGDAANKLSGGLLGGGGSSAPAGPSKQTMATPKWQGAHQVGAAKQQLNVAKKSGNTGNIAMAKEGVAAEKSRRADLFKQASSAPKGTGQRKAAMQELKTNYKGAWNAKQAAKKKSSGGGGIMSKMSGGLF